jgi:hypothetical protein
MAEVGARVEEGVSKVRAMADEAAGNGADASSDAVGTIAETEPVASA